MYVLGVIINTSSPQRKCLWLATHVKACTCRHVELVTLCVVLMDQSDCCKRTMCHAILFLRVVVIFVRVQITNSTSRVSYIYE